jgi:hypothetical protein
MDSEALQEGEFNLPNVLRPPESSYFGDVCLIFLVNETLLTAKSTEEL